jgi:acyl transferase domain-containing protein
MKLSTIAIVGMAGRFPGARNVSEFWQNLHDGVESIRSRSDAELLAAGVTPEELASPEYVKRASVLDDVRCILLRLQSKRRIHHGSAAPAFS